MANRPSIVPLIGEVYDAALAPEGLSRLALIAMTAGGGGSAVVSVFAPDGKLDAAICVLPEDTLQRYLAHYHAVNPLPRAALRHGIGMQVSRSADVLPDQEFRSTEFYTDFARGLDAVQVLGIPAIPLGRGRVGEVGVHRGLRDRPFASTEMARLEALVPHFQRALQLRYRLGLAGADAIGLAALDALAIGCVVCNGAGVLVFANAAAEALDGHGLRLGGSAPGIHTDSPTASAKLVDVMADVLAGGAGGAATLRHADRRMFLLAAPLPERFGSDPNHVLVTIRMEDPEPPVNAAALQGLFGLTAAEARLALALFAGASLADIGDKHGVTQNTVRTQLTAVLRKTGTSNQRDLVRLLGLVPPLRRGV